MKKILTSWRLLVLIALLICAVLVFLMEKTEVLKSQQVSSDTSGIAQLFEKLMTSSEAENLSTASINTTRQNTLAAQSVTTPINDVCEDMAAGRHNKKDWEQLDADLQKKLDATLPTLAQALEKAAQAQNPVEKASALYLLAELKGRQAENAFTQNRTLCETDEACRSKMQSAHDDAFRINVNEIAKLAIYSNDAKLYALAFNACNGSGEEGFCTQINARQWASRDSNNGMAWAHVLAGLSAVKTGKDASAIDDALFRLSKSNYFDGGFAVLANLKNNPDLLLLDSFAQMQLRELATRAWESTPLPAYAQVSNSCKGDFLNNPNRRQTCIDIVKKWQSDDALLIEYAMTKLIGKNLGWEPERIAKVQTEMEAIRGMLTLAEKEKTAAQKSPEMLAQNNCRARLKYLQDNEEMVTTGELRLLRKNLASHSKTPAELAAISRAEQAQRLADENKKKSPP
jgi:hypothetical protein